MLLQVRRVRTVILHTETRWENQLKIQKCNSSVGLGLGLDLKKKQHGKLNGQTWSSRHRKCVKTAIK